MKKAYGSGTDSKSARRVAVEEKSTKKAWSDSEPRPATKVSKQ